MTELTTFVTSILRLTAIARQDANGQSRAKWTDYRGITLEVDLDRLTHLLFVRSLSCLTTESRYMNNREQHDALSLGFSLAVAIDVQLDAMSSVRHLHVGRTPWLNRMLQCLKEVSAAHLHHGPDRADALSTAQYVLIPGRPRAVPDPPSYQGRSVEIWPPS